MSAATTELIARAVIRSGDRILVARERGKHYTFLPGGHVEPGEPVEQALTRELAEELGTTADIGELLGVVEHGYTEADTTHHELNLVFTVKVDGEPTSQESHLDFLWLTIDQLPNRTPGRAPRRADRQPGHPILAAVGSLTGLLAALEGTVTRIAVVGRRLPSPIHSGQPPSRLPLTYGCADGPAVRPYRTSAPNSRNKSTSAPSRSRSSRAAITSAILAIPKRSTSWPWIAAAASLSPRWCAECR